MLDQIGAWTILYRLPRLRLALVLGSAVKEEREQKHPRSATEADLTCCFCRRPGRKTGPLVVRGTMRICGHCLALAAATLEEHELPSPIQRRKKRHREEVIDSSRFTDRMHEVLGRAAQEAQNLGHSSVLQDHLVLAILGVADSLGAKVLAEVGVDDETVRRDLVARHPDRTDGSTPRHGTRDKTDPRVGPVGGAVTEPQLCGHGTPGAGPDTELGPGGPVKPARRRSREHA
ncbi:MAG: hypothetical protein GEU79_01250 [Acidimicrobiia bacterium]|nr:hypothetical protein [Acidimicrobiia bacterium]